MKNVLNEMRNRVENISDSITAIRSQVVTLNNDEKENIFTIRELLKYIDILTKNTLKEKFIILKNTIKVSKELEIKGNINSLVQVINVLIINSIDSYHGKTNQIIDLVIQKNGNNLEIMVIDSGCGIPKRIQSKIFNEIIIKEYGNKVGLGLFMAYSKIKSRI